MQVLSYIMEGLAILIVLFAAFAAGSYVQRLKLLDEWRRVESEWMDLAAEKATWADRVSRRLSPSDEPKNR